MAQLSMEERIAGCLIGGAAGDALGFPVEFLSAESIFRDFGERGITDYLLTGGKACISDDTQMTLFTADGLLRAEAAFGDPTPDEYVQSVYESYLNWVSFQTGEPLAPGVPATSLPDIPALRERRAPGNTCITALLSGRCGTFERRLNNSKGCGGVMRVAPVALLLAQRADCSRARADMVGARVAAITHGHLLGYLPAAFFTHVLGEILRGAPPERAVEDALFAVRILFCGSADRSRFFSLVRRAQELARDRAVFDDLDAVRELGGGWVAEETVAIAVYCALRHRDDFEAAVVAAVNHDGDSDSTGALTGNLVGALVGLSGIPARFLDPLEGKDVLLRTADQLVRT